MGGGGPDEGGGFNQSPTRFKPPSVPSSPCPRCYRNGTPAGEVPRIPGKATVLTFICGGCGTKWNSPQKNCERHGAFLAKGAGRAP